jgi:hypothetical protein
LQTVVYQTFNNHFITVQVYPEPAEGETSFDILRQALHEALSPSETEQFFIFS